MTERFRKAEKGAEYLAQSLERDFPDADLEVLMLMKARSRRVKCEVAKVATVLQTLCKDFPRASVDYYPSNPYGVVAEIRCHGDMARSDSSSGRSGRRDRPLIVVILEKMGGEEVEMGTYAVAERRHRA